jgi:phage terminase large subunit-like protein
MLAPNFTASFLAKNPQQRDDFIATLSDEESLALLYEWRFWARAEQLPPDSDWLCWLLLAGRGFGKTRTGAEWVRDQVESGRCKRIALVGPTAGDVRDVMVEGESGLLAISPPWDRPTYEPSKRRITWESGAIATTYSADEPERLRGPQHDGAWCDELGSWRYPEAWDMLQFGLRLGDQPRVVVTTTPKPVKLIRELLADPTTAPTRGTTYDNRANLAAPFFAKIVKKYEGTRLGRQELRAEILEDMPGALWTRALIESLRVRTAPELVRIVVAIDPATTSGENSDESGIIVAGIDRDQVGYVLDDLSIQGTPDEVCRRAVKAYRDYHADRIVAETNNGGDWIESLLKTADPNIAYRKVTASRGKATRAEPISSLYEQHRFHHVGAFPTLEDQMCAFTPGFDRKAAGYSPDRMDALVWAGTDLFGKAPIAMSAVGR